MTWCVRSGQMQQGEFGLIIPFMSAIDESAFAHDFTFQKKLGSGVSAQVYQFKHAKTGQSYAVKVAACGNEEALASNLNEIQALSALQDPAIPTLHYFLVRKKGAGSELVLVMELCGISLTDDIKQRHQRRQPYSKEELKRFLTQLVPFLAKMQRKGYLHRDIKPDNILLSRQRPFGFKLVDFGFAIFENIYSGANIAGTKEYASPKLRVKFEDHTSVVAAHNIKDDVYSLGRTFYEMMTLETKGAKINEQDILKTGYGEWFYNVLGKMIVEKEQYRPDFVELEKMFIEESLKVSQLKSLSKSTVDSPKRLSFRQPKFGFTSNVETRSRSKEKMGEFGRDHDALTKKREYKRVAKDNQTCRRSPIQDKPSRKHFDLEGQVHSIALCGDLMLVGTKTNLWVVDIERDRRVRVKLSEQGETVTCIRVYKLQNVIMFGTVGGLFVVMTIIGIKAVMNELQGCSRGKKQVEFGINSLESRVTNLKKSVSSLEVIGPSQARMALVGHHCGSMTVIAEDTFQPMLFLPEPVTCMKYHSGFVYYSLANGWLTKIPSFRVGLDKEKYSKSANRETACSYRQSSIIVGFEVITGCLKNKKIVKPENRYEVALVTVDGFFQIVSRSMQCQLSIRLSESPMLSVVFESAPELPWGVTVFAADENGAVYDSQGELVSDMRLKGTSCLSVDERRMALGSFSKGVCVQRRLESIMID